VSTGTNSWWGACRPPCGGTLATVPSRILRSACCTPSPETSRVIEGSRPCGRSVHLVDVDDPALALLDVVTGVLQQLEDDVLDVLADVAGLGKRGCVHQGEPGRQQPREGLREERLAGAGRADQEDVRLLDLDVVARRDISLRL